MLFHLLVRPLVTFPPCVAKHMHNNAEWKANKRPHKEVKEHKIPEESYKARIAKGVCFKCGLGGHTATIKAPLTGIFSFMVVHSYNPVVWWSPIKQFWEVVAYSRVL